MGEFWRPEAREDFHRAPGVGQGLGGLALSQESVGDPSVVTGDQFLTLDGFGQGQGLSRQSLCGQPIIPVEGQSSQIAGLGGHAFVESGHLVELGDLVFVGKQDVDSLRH